MWLRLAWFLFCFVQKNPNKTNKQRTILSQCLCPSFSQYFQRDCSPFRNGSWWKPSRGAILEDICVYVQCVYVQCVFIDEQMTSVFYYSFFLAKSVMVGLFNMSYKKATLFCKIKNFTNLWGPLKWPQLYGLEAIKSRFKGSFFWGPQNVPSNWTDPTVLVCFHIPVPVSRQEWTQPPIHTHTHTRTHNSAMC